MSERPQSVNFQRDSRTKAVLKRIDIPGATLSVNDIGQGSPILFVHGFPLDRTMWREQVADLSRDFRCVVPDLRGFGQSTVTAGKVTMERFADDLGELLDALQITESVVLCGLSMGGYIAWQFARRHAARLRGLILCDTRAAPDSSDAAANRLRLADDVVSLGPEVVVKAMLPKLVAPGFKVREPLWIEEIRQVMLATNSHGIAAASRGMAERADARPWLATIECPALVLVGEQDVISPPAEMSEIASALPRSTFRVIPDAGHLAPLENPQPVNEAIRTFLAATSFSTTTNE
ncbi:MAG: alpha/beta fold hydrolase [Planctomycetota bacterium]|nr:MAG: alpha/beta fold hydrolase [Planctomycetota bacterium]